MEASRLFLTPVIKEQICSNLTFEEAIFLRNALEFESLKCPISIQDPITQKEIILPGVNLITITLYDLIKRVGLDGALFEAIEYPNKFELIKNLLKIGADANAIDSQGETILMEAVNTDNKIVQLLLDAGADVKATNKFGKTTLMSVVSQKTDNPQIQEQINSIILTLLAAGADINQTENNGRTALKYAISYGTISTVKFLLKAGPLSEN